MNQFIKNIQSMIADRAKFWIDLPAKKMLGFYDGLDVFALTSENESFGRVLIEAMARGCAVLGTDSGGVPEVIGKSENLFPVQNATLLSQKILTYASDRKLLEQDKFLFRKRAEKLYSIENHTKKLCAIYHNVLEGKP
jgi:glycosyltransferase involved in cell wall biosynthesis